LLSANKLNIKSPITTPNNTIASPKSLNSLSGPQYSLNSKEIEFTLSGSIFEVSSHAPVSSVHSSHS